MKVLYSFLFVFIFGYYAFSQGQVCSTKLLADDLKDPDYGENLENWLKDRPDKGGEVWEYLIKHPEMRLKDENLWNKVHELIADDDFMTKVGGQDEFKKIINALKNPCCGNSATVYLKDVVEHLNDVKHLVKEYSTIPGYNKVIEALQHPLFTMQDGMSHFLNKVRNLEPDEVIESFEGFILGDAIADADDLSKICVNCLYDIRLQNGKKLELKSYSEITINKIYSNPEFRKQARSYFQDNGNLFDYVFNGKKIDQTQLEAGFKKMYETPVNGSPTYNFYDEVIGDGSPELKKWFLDNGITSKTKFKNAVNKTPPTNTVLYDFLKLLN